MNWRAVGTIVAKDITLYFRNRFFVVITLLGLIMYPVIYFVMPGSVDETLEIGLYAPSISAVFEQIQSAESEGLKIESVNSEEELKESVIDGRYVAGLALPADIMEKLTSGQIPEIEVYFASDTPEEFREIIDVVITEVAFMQTGQEMDIEWQPTILGTDMAGAQIPQRDRMRSLFAVLILITETFGLAGLIAEEVERKTAWALLVTPMTVKDLFTSKAIMGIIMAFGQAVLLMLIVRGFGVQPQIILIALLLGAVLVTGVAFLMASLGKELISVTAWGTPAMIILMIPAIGILIPGGMSDWIKAIPSHYLVDTIYRVSNFGAGWGDIWRNLLILAGYNAVIITVGVLALRRKFQ